MKVEFEKMEATILKNFNGGEKEVKAFMHIDELNKVFKGVLIPGASIGMHTHTTSSEIIYILKGNAKVICDGKEEILKAGDCHYCKKGSSHTFINDGTEDVEIFAVVCNQ